MTFRDAIYKRITELANKSDLTLSQLAIKSGMTPSTLYGIKSNDTKLPSLLSVKRICDGLGMTLAKFFDVDYISDSDFE
jgi:transcriptional regulator with XRE-family HTH domain